MPEQLDFLASGFKARPPVAEVWAPAPAAAGQVPFLAPQVPDNAESAVAGVGPLAARHGERLKWSDSVVAPLGIEKLRVSQLSRACGGLDLRDILFHLPTGYIDRRTKSSMRGFAPDAVNTFKVKVVEIVLPVRRSAPTRVIISDATGEGEIILFSRKSAHQFTVGLEYIVSGHCESTIGRVAMKHPDIVLPVGREWEMPWVDPSWPLVAGLSHRALRPIVQECVERMPVEPEWLHEKVVAKFGWPTFGEALERLHKPSEPPPAHVRNRIAYDEAFCRQVSFQIIKQASKFVAGRSFAGDGSLRAEALRRFGHEPTHDQLGALNEILADMASSQKMLRLVQGDVGSGKTLVALLAMLNVVESGAQAVLMVPTELLALQHFRTISRLSPVPVALLTGSMAASAKAKCARLIASGDFPIIVGTHAVFQKGVSYRDLGFMVIDEQHRFGVEERGALARKGRDPDTLLMTATPIPRTVFLSQMGWMNVSLIRGKPAGRKPIRTTVHDVETLPEVLSAVARMVDAGGRVYWVCPLVSESETLDLAAAQDRFVSLKERFGAKVALAHGQQPSDVRDAALQGFKEGRHSILVSTTVIEVGVDVPEASVMVIEHAERFGAAQLHQLRGRVGRGKAASYCLLVHAKSIGKMAKQRLKLLRDNDDGFAISEADYRLRGGGDIMGTKQSGLPGYRVVNPESDIDLLSLAARDAEHFIGQDPNFRNERGRAVLRGLEVFGLTAANRYLQAG